MEARWQPSALSHIPRNTDALRGENFTGNRDPAVQRVCWSSGPAVTRLLSI